MELRSPDLNLLENLWIFLADKVMAKNCTTVNGETRRRADQDQADQCLETNDVLWLQMC